MRIIELNQSEYTISAQCIAVLRNRAILPRFRFRVPIFFPTVPVQVSVPTIKC